MAHRRVISSCQAHSFSSWERLIYGGQRRRIAKAITGTGTFDCTYHYYYDQDKGIETRNGSDQTLKQQVWGIQYVDELVQVAVNADPSADDTCEALYWAMQDANWNVLGIVDSTGVLTERYEYTPYGQRTVFFSAGSNDPGCYAPTLMSRRVTSGSVTQPYSLCEFGHQGLMHDELTGLIYNRARMLQTVLGRFMQRDPNGMQLQLAIDFDWNPYLQYSDGLSLYQCARSNSLNLIDPGGTHSCKDECPDLRCPVIIASLTVPLDIKDKIVDKLKEIGRDKGIDWLKRRQAIKWELKGLVKGIDLLLNYFDAVQQVNSFDIYTYVVYADCEESPRDCKCSRMFRRIVGIPKIYVHKCNATNKPISNLTGGFSIFPGANPWDKIKTTFSKCQAEAMKDFAAEMKSKFPNCPQY